MSKGKRVLLLGPTGTQKHRVAERLSSWCQSNLGHAFRVFDFEKEYLTNPQRNRQPLASFLAMPVEQQHEKWKQAWNELEKEGVADDAEENRILLVHGSIVRGDYGVRCVCDISRLASFGADTIVTLIDDVYNLWWHTESRAHGEYHRGRPTLEQLIMARRTEQLFGDMIALQGKPRARHLVLALLHPIRTLAQYIFTAKRVVYLAFPITRPRKMLQQNGDRTGIEAVNAFLHRVYDEQRTSPSTVFVNPLSIDELQLSEAFADKDAQVVTKDGDDDVQGVHFDLARRWSLDNLWIQDELLSPGPILEKHRIPLMRQQLDDALGLMRTDVGWRDFRLVMQADALAVFCPVMARGRLSRGVLAEIRAACAQGKPSYVFQDPNFDPDGKFLEWLGTPGTMGADVAQQLITRVDSLDEMMERLRW